jgi:hypothetical protein
MTHLHLGLLACRIVNTVRFQLKKKVIMENKENLNRSLFSGKKL